jgi:hypothetical protein
MLPRGAGPDNDPDHPLDRLAGTWRQRPAALAPGPDSAHRDENLIGRPEVSCSRRWPGPGVDRHGWCRHSGPLVPWSGHRSRRLSGGPGLADQAFRRRSAARPSGRPGSVSGAARRRRPLAPGCLASGASGGEGTGRTPKEGCAQGTAPNGCCRTAHHHRTALDHPGLSGNRDTGRQE